MPPSARTETETVIKRILPYLQRRGYDVESDLAFEHATTRSDSYSKGYIDILVTCGRKKPSFIIEAKRASKTLNQNDRKQALSYAKSVRVPFVALTNGYEFQCFNAATGSAIRWNDSTEGKIPTRDQLSAVVGVLRANPQASEIDLTGDNTSPFRPGLPLKQLNELFRRCHNQIRKIEKDEEHAFADFAKFLFLKLLEEKSELEDFEVPYSYRFHELAARPESEADQVRNAVTQMLEEIRNSTPYGDVLEDGVCLQRPKTFHYLVRQLSSVYFTDTSVDFKGAAFEYYVRATLKGKRLGQYFTPRPLVQIMSSIVGEEKIVSAVLAGTPIRVVDPACGTGGFLVFLMKDSISRLNDRLASRKIIRRTRDEVARKIKQSVFYGADANHGVASAAKMNMIIAGDGHSNICAEESLSSDATTWSMGSPSCNIIMTNPPFGTSEADSLDSKDLQTYPIRTTRGQLLFVQKMVLSSMAGGDICTVIDEGVLNTASSADLRRWLFRTCEIVAVVRLPEETFKPNKINVRSSVLFLRRRDIDDVDLEDDYRVVFCDISSLGYYGSGESIRGFDFDRLRREIGMDALDTSRGSPRHGFEWRAFDVQAQSIVGDSSCRLDLKFWDPWTRKRLAALEKSPRTRTIRDLNLIPTRRGKSPPASSYVDERDGYALVVKAGSNISRYGELIKDGDFIEKNVFDEMSEFHLHDGDVLLASTGDGTLGKCCVFRSGVPAVADGHVTVIRVDLKQVYPEYLADYIRAGFGAVQVERLFTGSTGLIELASEQVDAIKVDLLLTVEEQQARSQKLREAERLYQSTSEQAVQRLVAAQEAFRGDH